MVSCFGTRFTRGLAWQAPKGVDVKKYLNAGPVVTGMTGTRACQDMLKSIG
jgi:hypothetical protein